MVQTWSSNQDGALGPIVDAITTGGDAVKIVQQTVALVDATGTAQGTSGNPIVVDTANQGQGASATITRPNNTTAYGAGDVIGQDTATSAISLTPLAGASGGDVLITSATLEIDLSAIPSGMTNFILYLYTVTPPSALADNAVWDLPSGDRASFLGSVTLGTPVDFGSTLWAEANGINKQVTAAGAGLFGYLVTVGAYTPAANTVFKVTLHTLEL